MKKMKERELKERRKKCEKKVENKVERKRKRKKNIIKKTLSQAPIRPRIEANFVQCEIVPISGVPS